jgi:superfamily II DNA or RNA helicase
MVINYDLELNENNKQAVQSDRILVKLKPHQLTSLNKAIDMENNSHINYKIKNFNYYNQSNLETGYTNVSIGTNIGILGDKVGYGKTLLALSIIANNPLNNIYINPEFMKTFNNEKTYNYLSISMSNNLIKRDRDIINSTLVIVPRGPVFVQWEETIKSKTNLKYLSITNLTHIKQTLPKWTGNNKDEIFDFFENYDVVLIKSTTYSTLCSEYYNFDIMKNWKRLMFDEAHEIISRIPSHINYHYLWLISGTYIDLFKRHNNNYYTYGIKKLLDEHNINLILVKNNEKFIRNSFHIPEPIEKYYLCKLPSNYLIAKKFLNSAIMDKINANDFAGAIRDLGGKNETEDNIIELVSKELKKDLKNKEREREYINDLDMSIEEKELKLKKIDLDIENHKNKLNDLTERIKCLSSNNCAICMDIVKNPIMLDCTHLYCGVCIMKWLDNNKNCPYCRNEIPSYKNLTAIVNNNTTTKDTIIDTKEDTFISIIKNKPNGKFLVFTKNDNGFEMIKKKMIENNIKYDFLKGNTQHMMNVLDKFKSGELKIILLNTQYAGSGIDINYATDVIIYHSMGIDKQQAIGRAQRVGRNEELYIHNLCYEHEI